MNKIYKDNLKAIKKYDNILYGKLINLDKYSPKGFTVEESKIANEYTLKVNNNKKMQYVHSKYNPLKNAEDKIENLEFDFYNIVLVLGVGCGHFIKEILNKTNEQSKIVVLENRIDILNEVLKYQDLRYLFNSNNIIFFDSSKKDYLLDIQNRFKKLDIMALVAGNLTIFKTPVLKQVESNIYKEQIKKVIDILKYLSNIMGNSSGDTLIGIQHMFDNIKFLFENSTDLTKISYLKDKPAVCVASGPSLEKNIDVLKEYQDDVFIFSAGTSLHKLVDYGITPDFFSVLERPEKVYNYTIKDLIKEDRYPRNLIAFLDGVVHNKIFEDSYPNNIPICRNTVPTESWFANNIDNLMGIDTGTSVANLNFMIAYLLGCSPIILVGQDLSFSKNGKQHVSGTIYDKLGEKKLKNKDYVEVEGYNGEKLLARKVWKDFKEWFEIKLLEYDIDCIDATEGGAYIKGTKIMSLESAAEKYFTVDKPNSLKQFFNLNEQEDIQKNLQSFLEKVEKKIEIYRDIKKQIEYLISSLRLITQLSNLMKLNKKIDFDYLINRYYAINTEISHMMTIDNVFFFICQPPFIELERSKVRKGDINIDTINKINNWASFNIEILKDVNNINDKTIRIFESGIDNILKFKENYNG